MAQARSALHAHVSRTRRVFRGLPGAPEVATCGQGYAVHVVDPGSVDVQRFQALVEEARQLTEAAERSRVLRAALDLWRGPALSDLAGGELRQRLCLELEESRLATFESWLDAELELGHHHDRIPDFGELHFLESRFAEAKACYLRGLEAAARSQDLQISAYLHHDAAEVELQLGNTEPAVTHARRELEVARAIDDPLRQAYGLDLLASLTMESDPGGAAELWQQARDITRKLAHPLADDISQLLTDLPGTASGTRRECLAQCRFRLARMP